MTATDQPETKSPSRRALLAGALGGIGAWAASAIGRVSPVRGVNGATGDVIHTGDLYSGVTAQTTLGNQANDNIVLWVASNADLGNGGGTALVGFSDHGIGVQGQTVGGDGVRGISNNGSGVWGTSNLGAGVRGSGDVGVEGSSSAGIGVFASSVSSTGVSAESFSGIGAYSRSSATNQPGSFGESWGNSTGVLGVSTGGTAPPTAKAKTGVYGYANQDNTASGVYGLSPLGVGVRGHSSSGYAGYFEGRVYTNAFYELGEVANPAPPLANRARLFVRDNGAGKTQLCVRFRTGGVHIIKTEL